MSNITQKQIYDKYIAYLQAQNSKINASAPFTYWSIIAGAESSTLLDLYANTDIVNKAIFIQNLQGSQIDNKLYETGLTPRGALTISVIGVIPTQPVPPPPATPPLTITIPANTQFQTPNGIIYTLYQDVTYTFPVTPPPPFTPLYSTPVTLYAIIGGSSTFIGNGTTLTATIGIDTITVTVAISTAGQNQESDQSCVNRLLLQQRSPTSGCRKQDYYSYAKEATTQVTDVIPVFPYTTIDGINSLGIFPLIGSFITEYQLNLGLPSVLPFPLPVPLPNPLPETLFTPYSRVPDDTTYEAVNTYILSLQLLGLNVIVGYCNTFTVDIDNLTVTVTLLPIYTILSVIQIQSLDASNNVITISIKIFELLQREVRRVICNQPYGGTDLGDTTYNFITLNDIVEGLNNQLSYNNGQIAKLLLDVQVTYDDPLLPSYNNIPVPKPQKGSQDNPDGVFEGIYDIIGYDTVTIIEKN